MSVMDEDSVQVFELGRVIAERVRAFEVAFDGGCGHDGVDQWASVGSTRAACVDCLRAASPVAPWERAGVCDACGRAMAAPSMTWAVGTSVGAVAVVRLCGDCRDEQVLAVGGPEPEGEWMDSKKRDALTRLMEGRAWAPALTASAGGSMDCCERCFAFVQTAAVGGIAERLPLHADCHRSLAVWANAAFKADRSLRGRAERIADARAVLVLARAEVRP